MLPFSKGLEPVMKQKKVRFLVGSLLIVGAIGYLITMGISNTSQYFFTVDELLSQQVSYAGAGLKVKGNVVDGSIERDPNDYLDVKFLIEENKSSLKVTYKGVTPDMFADGREVVVEGTLGRDGVFHANTLLTSCPSKYEAEKEAGKMHPGSLNTDKYKEPGLKKTDTLPKTTI
jgi:cytochrome c-type biogenesis protein CcmE